MDTRLDIDLAEHLEALAADERFVVWETLKRTDIECTEKGVIRKADGTESGPFVRKRFARCDGVGSVYPRLFAACKAGIAFKHLPRIFDFHNAGAESVVVMQFIGAETLEEVVRRCGPSAELAVDVGIRLCEAVEELHSLFDPPIIHRDLKPSNIMLGKDTLYLIDFGIARTFTRDAERDTACFGTRDYAPPEQFGFGQTDVRSDIYSLGAVVSYCATGAACALRSPNASASRMPACLRDIVLTATSLDPASRYQSAPEMRCALERAARDLRISSRATAKTTDYALRPAEIPPAPGAPAPVSRAGDDGSRARRVESERRAFGEQPAQPACSVRPAPLSPRKPAFLRRAADAVADVSARVSAAIPLGVGIAWNTVLGCVFVLFVAVFVRLVAYPMQGSFAYDGPWVYRFACYGALVFLGIGSFLFIVSDRRLLHRRLPKLFRLSYAAESLVAAGVVVLAGFVIIASVFAYQLVA